MLGLSFPSSQLFFKVQSFTLEVSVKPPAEGNTFESLKVLVSLEVSFGGLKRFRVSGASASSVLLLKT